MLYTILCLEIVSRGTENENNELTLTIITVQWNSENRKMPKKFSTLSVFKYNHKGTIVLKPSFM